MLFVSCHGFREKLFVSSGMDDAVKIWSWDGRAPFLESAGMAADVACQIETPLFTSTALHSDYVDCVHWYGDVLISKSVDNCLVMWRPAVDIATLAAGALAPQTAFVVLREFDIPNCGLWYIRFALSADLTVMACGNRVGGVHVWRLGDYVGGAASARMQLKVRVPVRIVQFDASGEHVLAGLENGTVHVFALVHSENDDSPVPEAAAASDSDKSEAGDKMDATL